MSAEDDEARRLEDSLRDVAKRLGMRIRVLHDAFNLSYHVETALIPERAVCQIDEEMIGSARNASALSDLMQRELEDLQCRLHDATRAAIAKRDVRGGHYVLTLEDKRLLHAMLDDALAWQMRDYSRAEAGCKKVDEYSRLLGRIFK
jgi:predicted RecB family endonuclease